RRYGFFQIQNPFTAKHWQDLFYVPAFLSSAANSLKLAATVAVVVVVVYSLVAYRLVRIPSRATRTGEVLLWVPWAVPGILMSLGLLWMLLGTLLRSALYGTLFGIILVIVIQESS